VVWQNEFVDNRIGIHIAAGAAHAYENIFRGSTSADLRYDNMGVFASATTSRSDRTASST